MSYSIEEAFQRIEEELIASMARNLKHHVNLEKADGFEYTMWQAEQLAALKEYRDQNKKAFSGYFSTINDKIGEVIQKAYETGNLDQEIEILEALKKGLKLPKAKDAGKIQGAFFRINQRKIDALIKATTGEMARAETAMLRMADDAYRQTIFNAATYYNTGAGTLPQCVDMATKDFLAKGINCVEYANGARVGIDSYARMALRTAQTRAYVQGEATKRDEWGVNTVIVNRRGVACPRCLKYVGKVFYDDVWGSIAVTDNKYPRLSTAIEGGLYHPNCKDIHTTYFEGINSPPARMTKAQVAEANRVYQLEQEQRYNERQIRKYKRLALGTVDPEMKAGYQAKLKAWTNRQTEFVDNNSDVLKRRPELEKIFPEFGGHSANAGIKKVLDEKLDNVYTEAAGTLPEHMKKYVPKEEDRKRIIEDGIRRERPIFADGDLGKYAPYITPEEGYYDVILHGTPNYFDYFGETIDADTLCAIIAQREDYEKGTPIRLISCDTGKTDDGVAAYIARKLKVRVKAPTTTAIVYPPVSRRSKVVPETARGLGDGEWRMFGEEEKYDK